MEDGLQWIIELLQPIKIRQLYRVCPRILENTDRNTNTIMSVHLFG